MTVKSFTPPPRLGPYSFPEDNARLSQDLGLDEMWKTRLIEWIQEFVATPSGIVAPYLGTTAPNGWILMIGETLGNTQSGADHASQAYRNLFDILKDVDPNAGTEDFDNGDTVTIPDARGRGFLIMDSLGGSSANVVTASEADTMGDTLGNETKSLSASEVPANQTNNNRGSGILPTVTDTAHTGTGNAFSLLQPSLVTGAIIKI